MAKLWVYEFGALSPVQGALNAIGFGLHVPPHDPERFQAAMKKEELIAEAGMASESSKIVKADLKSYWNNVEVGSSSDGMRSAHRVHDVVLAERARSLIREPAQDARCMKSVTAARQHHQRLAALKARQADRALKLRRLVKGWAGQGRGRGGRGGRRCRCHSGGRGRIIVVVHRLVCSKARPTRSAPRARKRRRHHVVEASEQPGAPGALQSIPRGGSGAGLASVRHRLVRFWPRQAGRKLRVLPLSRRRRRRQRC